MKKIISALMSLALVLTTVASSWATISEKTNDTFTYSSNGMMLKADGHTTINGVKTLADTTYYNTNGTRNYTKDVNGNFTAKWNYDEKSGNNVSVTFTQKDEAGNTHVVTTFNFNGIAISVDHGNGATLGESGVSGGKAISRESVIAAYNAVLGGASWANNILESIFSISIEGSVLKNLSASVVSRLLGYSGIGAVGQISQADVDKIKGDAASNSRSDFTFKFGSNHLAGEYSYFNKDSSSVIANNIKAIEPPPAPPRKDPIVNGTINKIIPALDANGNQMRDDKGNLLYYVVVNAQKINMLDGEVAKPADGEEIYVQIDKATYDALVGKEGEEISIAGDVKRSENGQLTMKKNEGGFKTGANSYDNLMNENKGFFDSMITVMAAVYLNLGVVGLLWTTMWAALALG